ncbi:MAG: GGDEF domain-containing protein, partial [Nakamurella sp.]
MGNRRHFYLAADEHLNEAREAGAEVALLLIDLDRFKDINNTLGHQAGDVLLHEVAQRLRRILPAACVLARLGGDEFVTLLPTTDRPTSAVHSAERFLCALDEPIYVDGLAIRVRASIGIAASHQADDDRATLLRHADVAMYQAKAKGS